MALEAGLSLLGAWTARSPALLAFGGDSIVELFSASVVFWRFTTRTAQERAERSASRIAGVLLFALGAFVVFSSVKMLLDHIQPSPSFLGICVLLAAVTIMPWLAREKRRLSALTCGAVLRADAAQSNLCAYLALVALAGLIANALWQIRWADPIAALLVVPFVGYEAVQAIRGRHVVVAEIDPPSFPKRIQFGQIETASPFVFSKAQQNESHRRPSTFSLWPLTCLVLFRRLRYRHARFASPPTPPPHPLMALFIVLWLMNSSKQIQEAVGGTKVCGSN